MEDYKTNSHKSKMEEEKKEILPVVNGPVKTKKKSVSQKLMDIFVAEDVGDVKSYVFMDVLIPAFKKAIWDIFTGSLEMTLFGGKGSSKNNSASRISYTKYYDSDKREARAQTRIGYNFDEVIFNSRGEAEEVLSRMDELINSYGIVSVADFYDLANLHSNYTDNKYGWNDIRNASVMRVRDGYIIKLPKALPLN